MLVIFWNGWVCQCRGVGVGLATQRLAGFANWVATDAYCPPLTASSLIHTNSSLIIFIQPPTQ